jgi:hypothetical protein
MKRWKKWALRVGLSLLGIGMVFGLVRVGLRSFSRSGGEARVAEVMAKLDADEPGWRLDDILAAREANVPPDKQNVFRLVQEVDPQAPKEFTDWIGTDKWLPEKELNHLPNSEDAARAKKVREDCRKAIDKLRRIRDLKQGYSRLTVPDNPMAAKFEHLQPIRHAVSLLQFDATVAALGGDYDQAIDTIRALENAACAIGDEPALISMLVRIACDAIAKRTTERVLAWGEPRDGLAELQATISREADVPLITIGLWGERAIIGLVFERVDSGALDIRDLGWDGPKMPKSFDPEFAIGQWVYRGFLPDDRANYLETMTRLIAISRKPAHERMGLFSLEEDRFRTRLADPDLSRQYILTRLLLPGWVKVATAELRSIANMRSAAVGIACERFRQANGRWPNDLTEIPRSILPEIPLDPFDGKPIRYRQIDDGVVVYCVGSDLVDDGGNLSYGRLEPGEDIGFRLWDPKYRRAAPLPKPKADEEP